MQALVFLIIGMGIGYLIGRHWHGRARVEDAETLNTVNAQRVRQMEEHLADVLTLMAGRESTTNNDLERLLGVSDATATRYFDMLEARGRVTRKGAGSATRYRLTPV